MNKYYKNNKNEIFGLSPLDIANNRHIGLIELIDEEIYAHLNPAKTEEQILENYKSYYLEVWNKKLKELDYDGIETVIFWKTTATDQTFKAEATQLANWYEAMITFNYTTLNAVSAGTMVQPTKEEYLALLPKFEDII